MNESVKKTTRCVVFSGCPKAFAKHKNISHGLLCKRQEQIPVSLCSETGILHDAVHRAARGVNPGSQASVTIIRSLALNEIGTRDALSLIIFCLLSVSILA